VVVGTYIANKFDGDPVWLLLIAAPSNAKTEILRAFEGHPEAVFVSSMTAATLVSGMHSKKGNPDTSLLFNLNDKMLVLKDFTSILTLPSETQQVVIAQLRESYDGRYDKNFGNEKEVHWKGRFGLIGGTTPAYDAHHGIINKMGERFTLYRIEAVNGQKMGLQAQKIVGQEEAMRAEIREALHKFISQFDDLGNTGFALQGDIGDKIVDLCCFTAYGRCPVDRDRGPGRPIKYDPIPEGTARLNKQLTQLGMGLALAYGKNQIDSEVFEVLKKIGRDLIPTQRLRIIKHLWEEDITADSGDYLRTSEISKATKMPGSTAMLVLEDLMTVGVLNRDREDSLEEAKEGKKDTRPWIWQITKEVSQWIESAEIFPGYTFTHNVGGRSS
jgi:hypothetical protein